uniref:30S ribosomal protein S21 n=1 Tax=Octactis speculum TaxID=3111310 RepID=A0A7S2C4M7_9STRA
MTLYVTNSSLQGSSMKQSRVFVTFLAALLALPSMAFVARTNILTQPSSVRSARSTTSMQVQVTANDGEPLESLLRRFKREVNKSGHMIELRHRRYFEDSQDMKKRKIQEARRRVKAQRMSRRRKNNFGAAPNQAQN